MSNKRAVSQSKFKCGAAFSQSRATPQGFAHRAREAADDFSDLLYAWDEAKKTRAAKRERSRRDKQHIGVRSFSWETGQ